MGTALSVSCADSSPTGGSQVPGPVIARRGKAPTRQSVSHAKNKSPDGGIDKLPNHVILKTKGGAAGRREPLCGLQKEVIVSGAS